MKDPDTFYLSYWLFSHLPPSLRLSLRVRQLLEPLTSACILHSRGQKRGRKTQPGCFLAKPVPFYRGISKVLHNDLNCIPWARNKIDGHTEQQRRFGKCRCLILAGEEAGFSLNRNWVRRQSHPLDIRESTGRMRTSTSAKPLKAFHAYHMPS